MFLISFHHSRDHTESWPFPMNVSIYDMRESYFAARVKTPACCIEYDHLRPQVLCSVLQFYIHYFPDVERKLIVTATVTDNKRNVEGKNELYMYNLQQLLSTNIMKKH